MGFGDNWELNHVGLMITDRNATLRHFQAIGVGVSVGPQPLLPHEPGEGSLTLYRTLEGDPMTNTYPTGGAHNFRDGECQIGDCQLECYPMRPGPGSFISEYLAKQGPGINHICFNTPNIEEDTEVFLNLGCELTFDARVNGKTVENYLDTRQHGDLMISLRPPPTDWERAWKANNEAHPLVPRWQFLGLGIAVAELDATTHLAQDRRGELIPLGQELAGLDPVTLFDLELSTVHETVVLTLSSGVVHDDELAVAVHDDHRPITLGGNHGATGRWSS